MKEKNHILLSILEGGWLNNVAVICFKSEILKKIKFSVLLRIAIICEGQRGDNSFDYIYIHLNLLEFRITVNVF